MTEEAIEVQQMDENALIVVEQLPVIKQQLEQIKIMFMAAAEEAKAMECTEDNLNLVRAKRAELTKIFKALEDRRKAVKAAILAPFDDFETDYKECVTNIYKPVDAKLAQKITEVVDGLKTKKRTIAQDYFNEYAKSLSIEFITLDRVGLNIGLSTSKKSIQTTIKTFLDKVNDELQLIETQPYKEEILVEYKKSLNAAQAITLVSERHKAIEEEQRRREMAALAKAEQEEAAARMQENVEAAIEEFTPPVAEPIPEEPTEEEALTEETVRVYEVTFKVRTTSIEKLKALKNFLVEGEYEYEQS